MLLATILSTNKGCKTLLKKFFAARFFHNSSSFIFPLIYNKIFIRETSTKNIYIQTNENANEKKIDTVVGQQQHNID